ncbi:hypothetical protein [Bacillus cereus]|uniref:hypothetical protein n=1 Tax=Bacillus cereus TaxID=1396 RepID=UPI00027ABF1D|nr:hypothetical protein [Bacillus cereus]EJS78646.1 hypothetical protein ICY_00245 [Bacillus cereus BAG2X1-3]
MLKKVGTALITISLSVSLLVACSNKEETATQPQQQDQSKPVEKSEPKETGNITNKKETTQPQQQDQSKPVEKSEPKEAGNITDKKEATQPQQQDQSKPVEKSEPEVTSTITDTDARKLIANFLGMNPPEVINIKNYGKTKDGREKYTARNNPEFVGHTGGTMLIGWFAIDPKTKEVTEIESTDM